MLTIAAHALVIIGTVPLALVRPVIWLPVTSVGSLAVTSFAPLLLVVAAQTRSDTKESNHLPTAVSLE